jgi:membrane protease YdiL (CAAX protease family)
MSLTQPELEVPPPRDPSGQIAGQDAGPAQPRLGYHLFFGSDGLRAVWGIVLFLLFRELLSYCVFPLLHLLPAGPATSDGLIAPRWLLFSEGGGLLCLLGATWLMARIELRTVAAYGFGPQRQLRNFGVGILCGIGLLSVLVAVLRLLGLLEFDSRVLFGAAVFRYGLLWGAGFLLVAAVEETYLRGYLQFTLTRGLGEIYRWLLGTAHADAFGFWTAAVILSLVFGIGHGSNPGESPLGMTAAGLVGLIFCLSLWRTGSLWWAIGFHAAWDWAQSFLYGVADSGLKVQGHLFATHPSGLPCLSGGATGPEGSIFMMPVVCLAVAAVILLLPRTHAGYASAGPTQAAAALDLA